MSDKIKKYRLVTRSDFDGLVSAVLFKHLDMIDEIKFVHAQDMQDGKIQLGERDVTIKLPYVRGVYLAFDHHLSHTVPNMGEHPNHVIFPEARSTARVVYDFYGGGKAFPSAWNEMMAAVDKGASAQFGCRDILHPQRWDFLNFLMDARTGLGRFHTFRISNYAFMTNMIDYCRNYPIDQIMQMADVKERIDLYLQHEDAFKAQIKRCVKLHKNLAVLDLRHETIIYAGNRFMMYALYPEVNISLHVLSGLKRQNTVFAIGKSITNRSSRTNISDLMSQYGGMGHDNAGSCQIENDQATDVLNALIAQINADG